MGDSLDTLIGDCIELRTKIKAFLDEHEEVNVEIDDLIELALLADAVGSLLGGVARTFDDESEEVIE